MEASIFRAVPEVNEVSRTFASLKDGVGRETHQTRGVQSSVRR